MLQLFIVIYSISMIVPRTSFYFLCLFASFHYFTPFFAVCARCGVMAAFQYLNYGVCMQE